MLRAAQRAEGYDGRLAGARGPAEEAALGQVARGGAHRDQTDGGARQPRQAAYLAHAGAPT
jgi:hypothetical protein